MNGNKVLVVEDNALFAQLCESLFRSLGCSVVHAASRVDALGVLQQAQPDMILVDSHLPDGSGVDATRAIRAREAFAGTPIIGLASGDCGLEPEALMSAGCSATVTKPVNLSELAALGRRLLATGRAC